MVIKGKNPVRDLRANLGITQMLPRNTGTKGDIIGTGVNDLVLLRDPTKASTTAAVGQDTAGTGADLLRACVTSWFYYPQYDVWTRKPLKAD